MKKAWLLTMLSGFLLYLTADVFFWLSCSHLSGSVFSSVITFLFVLGAIVTVVPFFLHRASLKQQFLSCLFIQFEFWLLFISDSLIGVTRNFVSFPADDYSVGLLLVTFWMFFSQISIISFLSATVIQVTKRALSK